MEKVYTKNAPEAIGPYSQAVKVGGLVANAKNAINNSDVYCNVQAVNCIAGMITGVTRTAGTIVASNCKIGGQIATTGNKKNEVVGVNPDTMQPIYGEVEEPIWKTLVDKDATLGENDVYFYNHIYGGETDWTGVENYDSCTWWSGPTE